MILRITPILLLLLILPAWVIYRMHFKNSKTWKKILLLAPNAILCLLTIYYALHDNVINKNAEAIAIFLIIVFAITIPEAMFSVVCGCFRLSSNRNIRKMGLITGFVVAVLFDFLVFSSVISCFKPPLVTKYCFISNDLPKAFDGYKIVHLSDLHVGTFKLYPQAMRNIVRKINAEKADLIAFTGDLVNFDSDEIRYFRKELSEFKAKDGVVSVMGNHDYLMYIDFKNDSANIGHIKNLQTEQKNAGWHLLLNENIPIHRGNDSIYIIGSENDGEKPFPSRGNLNAAQKGLPKSCFKVLLTHDPSQWRKKVLPLTDIQLTLSGHTHAGQIKLLGHSVSEIKYKEWNGMYYEGNRALLISSGVGEALVPFRLGAWPNIDVVVLKRK